MRIGAETRPKHDLRLEIQEIVKLGFDYVEIVLAAPGGALEANAWQDIGALLGDLNAVAVCQAAGYLPMANPSPLVRQAALDELRRSIDAAALLGAAYLSIPWPGWPDYLSEAEGYLFTAQWSKILGEHGRKQGVTVAVINSPSNQHQLKYFRELFNRTPNLSLSYDVGHSNIQTPQSLTRDYLFSLADKLRLVYLSDNDGRTDQHLPLGAPEAGGIRLTHELRMLRSFRYDGPITLQVHGDRRWLTASRDILAATWSQVG